MNHIYIYIVGAIIFSFIPYIRSITGTIHTLIHESGHAFAALVTSGKVYSISLFANREGVAHTGSRSWLSSMIISYSGYTFASIVSFLSFYLITNEKIIILFYAFVSLALINLLLWVRNIFGVIWISLYLGGCALLIYYQLWFIKEVVVYLLSSVILVQSVFASFAILVLSMKNTPKAGDALLLQKLTYIPSFFWGLLFFSQSLFSTYCIFRFLL
ncbi:M50 family metallopeptidase [Halalkalibacter kiskunsagensis]|uniref:M50 family metallopeptidase n=1 Tax=Halalkalibacter kiskunsagensis TaxID=1548599 RepID=A0ABV6KAZ4_9BACI